MRVPWSARRSNQLILKKINPEYLLEGLLLKLKLQYFGYQMQTTDSLEKTLILGKIEGRGRMGQQRKRWLDGITDPMAMSSSKLKEIVKGREAWRVLKFMVLQSVGRDLATEHQEPPLPLWSGVSELSEVLSPRLQFSFSPQMKQPATLTLFICF